MNEKRERRPGTAERLFPIDLTEFAREDTGELQEFALSELPEGGYVYGDAE